MVSTFTNFLPTPQVRSMSQRQQMKGLATLTAMCKESKLAQGNPVLQGLIEKADEVLDRHNQSHSVGNSVGMTEAEIERAMDPNKPWNRSLLDGGPPSTESTEAEREEIRQMMRDGIITIKFDTDNNNK